MRLNKKGDIGFPEVLMSVMVVTIVLSAYVAIIAYDGIPSNDDLPEFDRDLVDIIVIENEVVTGNISEKLIEFADKNGYRGIIVNCISPGNIVDCDLRFSVGFMDNEITGEKFVRSIPTDDGRSIPIIFEVAICI
ncbi:MAG: hypothetical protein M0P07_03770 [Candidatus Methanomethylophilaceae archaeon]|nr:hypothetical protein [Candidatus Methanomethylophilaceae archaeon]